MASFSQLVKPVYIAGGASIAIGVIDKSAFAYGVSSENPCGGVYQDTLPTLSAGTTGAVRLTSFRAFHNNLRDSSGNELLGQQLMAASLPVAIASNQSTLPVSAASLPLPTGAATEVTLAAMSAKLPAALGQLAMAASLSVAIASNQSAFPVSQSGTWNITNISGTISLPTGASTSALQTTISGQLPATLGQKAMAASMSVAIASDQTAIPASQSGTWTVQPGNTPNTTAWLAKAAGKASANAPARNDYTSVNVTTGAYVQLVASTTSASTEIEIFDSSGQTLALAVGAAASEVIQLYIFPGGNGRVPLAIPASSRVSIKAVSATASVGEIDVNFYA